MPPFFPVKRSLAAINISGPTFPTNRRCSFHFVRKHARKASRLISANFLGIGRLFNGGPIQPGVDDRCGPNFTTDGLRSILTKRPRGNLRGIQAPPRLPPLPTLPTLREGGREGKRRLDQGAGRGRGAQTAQPAPHSIQFGECGAGCGVATSRPRPFGRGQARAG